MFNMAGELVAIVNAKYAGIGIEGIGFAIPIDRVVDIVTQMISKGYVEGRHDLGISTEHNLYGIECVRVPEFDCIGRGGLYLSGLDRALVVSMGTGTAIVHARKDAEMQYLGGTGVGGGTFLGLSRLLVGAADIGHISEFVEMGNLDNIDLRIKDMTASGTEPVINADMTAANFGNISDVATKYDVAKGVANLVYETVGMVSVFASRSVGVTDIILTGNMTRLPSCLKKFEEFNNLGYGVRFIIPELAEFSTAIGCAISALN